MSASKLSTAKHLNNPPQLLTINEGLDVPDVPEHQMPFANEDFQALHTPFIPPCRPFQALPALPALRQRCQGCVCDHQDAMAWLRSLYSRSLGV